MFPFDGYTSLYADKAYALNREDQILEAKRILMFFKAVGLSSELYVMTTTDQMMVAVTKVEQALNKVTLIIIMRVCER